MPHNSAHLTAPTADADADVLVLGAGAAGLFAGIHAARRLRELGQPARVLLLDSAKKVGAKILVAGGGRCNVTHDIVDHTSYFGSSQTAVRKVLGRFTVQDTIAFFEALGIALKREDTGKLFPTTDDANTVLDALLRAVRDAGATLTHPWRAARVSHDAQTNHFIVSRDTAQPAPASQADVLRARTLILATGGMALPRTGSDGAGYAFARHFGHSVTDAIIPALVPLLLEKGFWTHDHSGIAVPARLELRTATGKRVITMDGPVLLTHFGISGPAALDISRHVQTLRAADPACSLLMHWAPHLGDVESIDRLLTAPGASPRSVLHTHARLPERIADALCRAAGVREPALPSQNTPRERRRALAQLLCATPLPVIGDRGFTFAEVTAGGVPLSEVRLETMESRVRSNLFLCGELLDVDGRIGGYNFQWAWASGFLAGRGAADALHATASRAHEEPR